MSNIARVKPVAQIKAGKANAAFEHSLHHCNITCIKTAQVKTFKSPTVSKHNVHVFNLARIKIA